MITITYLFVYLDKCSVGHLLSISEMWQKLVTNFRPTTDVNNESRDDIADHKHKVTGNCGDKSDVEDEDARNGDDGSFYKYDACDE